MREPLTAPGTDQAQYVLSTARSGQNLVLGSLAGAAAAIIGAGVWAAVTVVSGYQIGWMAVGVGALVGLGVRAFGKGIDRSFGIAGAMLALAGCVAGNLLAVCGMISIQESVSFFEILSRLTPAIAVDLTTATFSPIDVLFYGLALYYGYRFSIRQLTSQEEQGLRPAAETNAAG